MVSISLEKESTDKMVNRDKISEYLSLLDRITSLDPGRLDPGISPPWGQGWQKREDKQLETLTFLGVFPPFVF
jgi:hypothetical protein